MNYQDSLSTTRYLHGFQYYDNVRVNYAQDPYTGAVEILEESHYYPFGLQHSNYNTDLWALDRLSNQNGSGGNNSNTDLKTIVQTEKPHIPIANPGYNYKFNGMELQEEFGTVFYDFGARNYMPDLGRWANPDPYMELMRKQSPYNYAFNNPIYFADYNGGIPWPVPEMFLNWHRRADSKFRTKTRPNHNGIDINFTGGGNTDYNAPVLATHSGRVTKIETSIQGRAGRYIELTSIDGKVKTRYLHLSMICVQYDDEIDEGMTIGLLGGSGEGLEMTKDGGKTGYWAHLHYEIHRNGQAIDPWDSNNNQPHDPQKWISKMGPHQSPSAYSNSGAGFDLLSSMFNQWVEDTKRDNQSSSSTNSSGSNSPANIPRPPANPASSLAPMPIVPNPITPGGGGGAPTPLDYPGGGGGTVTPPVMIPCGIDC